MLFQIDYSRKSHLRLESPKSRGRKRRLHSLPRTLHHPSRSTKAPLLHRVLPQACRRTMACCHRCAHSPLLTMCRSLLASSAAVYAPCREASGPASPPSPNASLDMHPHQRLDAETRHTGADRGHPSCRASPESRHSVIGAQHRQPNSAVHGGYLTSHCRRNAKALWQLLTID